MLTALAFIGSLIVASLGFIIGRFYAESERILAEKRQHYIEFLSALPPLQDTYKGLEDYGDVAPCDGACPKSTVLR